MKRWKNRQGSRAAMTARRKKVERLMSLTCLPKMEALENRIAPATFQYSAPLGQIFDATLRAAGTDLQLVDSNGSLLADMPLTDVTQVAVTGSDQASRLNIDESSPFSFPITFDLGAQTNPAADSLHLIGDSTAAAAFTPGLTAGDSSRLLFGGNTITFGADVPLTVDHLEGFTWISPGSNDTLQISSPAAGENAITGTSGGAAFGSFTFSNVANVAIDMASHSAILGNDGASLLPSGLTAAGLKNFRIETGNGQNTISIGTTDLSLPVAGGRFDIDGGAGATTLAGPDAENLWSLSGNNAGTLTNTTPGQNGAPGVVNFFNVGTLAGGPLADTFTVDSSSTFAGTILGGGGGDQVTVNLGQKTGAISVDDTGRAGNNTLAVNSFALLDQLVDNGSSVVSNDYAPVHYAGIQSVTTSVASDLQSIIQNELNLFANGLTGTQTITPGNIKLGGALGLVNPTLVFQDINYQPGGTSSGTVSITAERATLFPGKSVSADINDGGNPGSNAIVGTYNLATGTYSLTAAQIDINLPDISTTAANLTISYDPSLPLSQTIVHLANVTATLPRLDNITATVAGLTIRGDGFSVDNSSVTVGTISLSSALSVTAPTLTFDNVNYTAGNDTTLPNFSGTIGISAGSATLFSGGQFTGTITAINQGDPAISGHYDIATDLLSLSAEQVSLSDAGLFTATADNLAFAFSPEITSPQTLATIGSIALVVTPLNGLSVSVTNLAIRTDGFSFDDATASLNSLSLGGFLTIIQPTISFTGVDFTTSQGSDPANFTGTLTLSAASASLFPGKSFSGSITPLNSGDPAISGSFNLNTQAFSLNAGQVDLSDSGLFTA